MSIACLWTLGLWNYYGFIRQILQIILHLHTFLYTMHCIKFLLTCLISLLFPFGVGSFLNTTHGNVNLPVLFSVSAVPRN